MRHLWIRFLHADEARPRATVTYFYGIPEERLDQIYRWLLKGEPIPYDPLGESRTVLTINVISQKGKGA